MRSIHAVPTQSQASQSLCHTYKPRRRYQTVSARSITASCSSMSDTPSPSIHLPCLEVLRAAAHIHFGHLRSRGTLFRDHQAPSTLHIINFLVWELHVWECGCGSSPHTLVDLVMWVTRWVEADLWIASLPEPRYSASHYGCRYAVFGLASGED